MKKLLRELTLWAVIAGAICNVIGGGINVLVVNVQHEVPGIGNLVPFAMILAGIFALAVSLVYASISTAFPRAGGEYLYISRSVSPAVGFTLAFVKWMGAIIALGTVAFMDSLILRDAFEFLGWHTAAGFLSTPVGQIIFSLTLLWFFWLINYIGVRSYGRTVIIFAVLMVLGGIGMMYLGFSHTHYEFLSAIGKPVVPAVKETSSILDLLKATGILFWAYIGFTAIAQSAGEIKNPKKNLPKAFIYSTILITLYYFLYSSALYHAVPWQYIYSENKEMTVPGLLGVFLPSELAILLTLFVFLALANDIPPLLYTKSRLFYSWAKDGIVPKKFASLNKFGVPGVALTIVTLLASLVAVICAFSNMFLEVDVVVFSRFFVYALTAVSLIMLPEKNPKLYKKITFLRDRRIQVFVSAVSIAISLILAGVLLYSDLVSETPFYLKSSFQTAFIFLIGYLIYWNASKHVDPRIFARLPAE